MFRIKICGITRVEDARDAATFGADAIGLNFVPGSPRCVSLELAAELAASVPPTVERVGVFADAELDRIREIVDAVGLTMVQLHGAEPIDRIQRLAPLSVIRVIRADPDRMSEILDQLCEHSASDSNLKALLLDAFHPGQLGGTGVQVATELIAAFLRQKPQLPWILAGGLHPENIVDAIRLARPDGVDTSSGVEIRPGIKDRDKVRRFISNAANELGYN
jgi:phosphoribosylanthranilate isomerase